MLRPARQSSTFAHALIGLALATGCASPDTCDEADLTPPPRPPAYAVLSSDYASTAIALLDADGELLDEAFVDSGTVPPGVVAALSGDVVLPSAPLEPCVLTSIDRLGTDVISFFDVCGGPPVIAQLEVAASRRTNPHDVLSLGGGRALVSRHDPDPTAATPLERGNDLLIVDWRAPRVVSRIDLSSLDTVVEVERTDRNGEIHLESVHAYARPSRMVLLRAGDTERALVGLARLDDSFAVAGPGAVALVDVERGAVEGIALPALAGCDEVDAVPGRPELAVVTCGGPAYVGEEGRRPTTGVVMVELGADGSASVRSTWRAAEHPEQPVYNTWAVPLDADRVVVTAMGDFGLGIDDRVGVLSMGGAQAAPLLMEAADAFVIGDGAYDAERGLLLVPDAEAGTVRRFSRDGDAFVELAPVDTAGCRGLVPREVRPLSGP